MAIVLLVAPVIYVALVYDANQEEQPWNPIGRILAAHVIISGFLRRLSRCIVGLGGYMGNYGVMMLLGYFITLMKFNRRLDVYGVSDA